MQSLKIYPKNTSILPVINTKIQIKHEIITKNQYGEYIRVTIE